MPELADLADPQIWLSLVTLAVLEIVLGIDNIVFIAVLTQKLPPERQAAARRLGRVQRAFGSHQVNMP